MAGVKDILLRVIPAEVANRYMRQWHYSGKVVPNSQLHFGVYWQGMLKGVMQFGPSTDKRKLQGLVAGTGWNEFIELNRLAFHDDLPKNSESRALAVAIRLLRRHAPHVKWVVSYADATQCGDGTIYRAAGFKLTQIKRNTAIYRMPDGTTMNQLTASAHRTHLQNGRAGPGIIKQQGGVLAEGYQLRYVYLLQPGLKLTVPELPYSAIAEAGARMYKGMRVKPSSEAAGFQPAEGGAEPTHAHQLAHSPAGRGTA